MLILTSSTISVFRLLAEIPVSTCEKASSILSRTAASPVPSRILYPPGVLSTDRRRNGAGFERRSMKETIAVLFAALTLCGCGSSSGGSSPLGSQPVNIQGAWSMNASQRLLFNYVDSEPLSKPFKTKLQAEKARRKYPECQRKTVLCFKGTGTSI
jgi:hypothetical protein